MPMVMETRPHVAPSSLVVRRDSLDLCKSLVASDAALTTKRFCSTAGNAAVFDYATGGPCFGAADLVIGEPKAAIMGGFAGPDMMDTSIGAGSLRSGRSAVGGSYGFAKDWPVRGEFQLVQLEVYCNAAINVARSSGPSWWPF